MAANQNQRRADADQFEIIFTSDYVQIPDLKKLRALAREHWNCDEMADVEPSVIIPAGSRKRIIIVGLQNLHNSLTQGTSPEHCIDYIAKHGSLPNVFGVALAIELFREKLHDRRAILGFDHPKHLAVMPGYSTGIVPMAYPEHGIIRYGREEFSNTVSYPDCFMYWSDQ